MPVQRSSRVLSVDQSVKELLAFMRKTNYTEETITRYRREYEKFLAFAKSKRLLAKSLTSDIINRYLTNIEFPELYSETDVEQHVLLHGKLKKLLQFQSTGMISRQRYRKIAPLSKPFQALQTRYLSWRLEEKSLSNETMRSARFETWKFLLYLEDNGVHSLSKVNAKHITAYFRKGNAYACETMGKRAYNLRHFFRFLVEADMVAPRIQTAIPKIKFVGRRRIPETWTKADIRKLLAAIDRGSPVGKRDYAICTLVIRLGMRVGDIRTLRLEYIDWNKAIISLPQHKTGSPLYLPMTEEVGNALIDYLKNGRPENGHREVFLRHNAPFSPFGERNNLSSIITKYRTAAGISLPRESRKGFHSLRHNIAARLHEAEIPLPVIASFLGHSTIDSTRHYAKADIKMLRKAALEWKEGNDE